MKKRATHRRIYSNSFAARLTASQRDELYEALSAGLKYDDGAAMVRDWIQANDAARPPGTPPGRPMALSNGSSIGKWFHAATAARRYEQARRAALTARARDPDDGKTPSRSALDQARYVALLEGLKPRDIAAFERNELAREKLALEREKFAHQALLKQAEALLRRTQEGDDGEDLQDQIDLALEEIQKMKRGED